MRRLALSFVLLLLLVVPASAQTTGSINGTITDNTGAVLPGVTVTARSPGLMGSQTTVTNPQGVYRFPSLPVGTYSLKFELPGFSTVTREDIVINIGFAATVNHQLQVATLAEAVTVTGEAPTIDIKNSNVQTNISQWQLNDLASARDIWSAIGMAPGFMVTSFDVGGSRAGTQTGYSAFGYSGQVRVQVDGVNTTEGTGSAGFYYDYGSFQEIQLGADGNDASAATPGVQLNAILKSGGNAFKGDIYYDYENKHLQAKNITEELKRVGAGEGTRILAYRDPNLSLGGPIKRDKFWFFGSFRDQRTGTTVSGFPAEAPSDFFFETRLTNVSYKLTYQLSQNNRIGHYIQWGRKFQPHRGAGASTYSDAVFRQDSWSWAANVDWNSVVGTRFFHNARYATFGYDWPNYAYGPNGEVNANLTRRMTDNASGNTRGSAASDQNDRKRHQFDWTGTYFRDDFIQGNHELKFGLTSEWETQVFTNYGFVDDLSLTFNSTQGRPEFSVPLSVTLRNTPNASADSTWHHGVFINDQWSIARGLTANIGVRVDYYSSYFPDQEILPAQFRGFFYAGEPLPNGYSIPPSPYADTFFIPGQYGFREHTSVAPRFGVAWDPFGKGKTVFKANWGRFYFNTGLASSDVNPNQSITYTFNWSDPNGDKQFQMDELGTFRSSGGGTTESIDPNIKHRYTDSTSVWVEHELFKDVGVRAGYTYKSDGNSSQAVQLSRLGSLYTSTVTARDPGVDGLFNTEDDGPPIIIYDIPTGTPVPPSRTTTQTVDGILAIDRALDLTLTKRMSNRWSVMTNFLYNWDRDRGRPQNPNQERFNDNTVTIWAYKLVGTYHAPWGIVVSPSLRHQAGDALARNVSVASGIDENGVARNLNIGSQTFEAERSGSYREDNITLFDTRLEKRFRLKNNTMSLFFDAFNITNSNASQSADSTVGRRTATVDGVAYDYQRFLRPTGVLPARVYRFGFHFSF